MKISVTILPSYYVNLYIPTKMLTPSFKLFSVYMEWGQQNFVQYLDNIKLGQDDAIKCSYTPHRASPTSTPKRQKSKLLPLNAISSNLSNLNKSHRNTPSTFYQVCLILHLFSSLSPFSYIRSTKRKYLCCIITQESLHIPYESIQKHLNHKQFLIQHTKCKKISN